MMSRLSSVVKQHPLVTFFVLAYALSWIIESPLVFLGDSVNDIQELVIRALASNVPSALGIVFTGIILGKGSVRKLLGRLLPWRVNPLWYLVVFLGPVALVGGVVGLNTLVGGPALSLGMPLLAVAITLAISIFPGSALGEEIGWRGYVLPRMQTRMSALSASLLLAPFWALWHLPLFVAGWLQGTQSPALYPAFIVSTIAFSVILTWVYNSTGGSLLMVVLLHATVNLPLSVSNNLGTQAMVPVFLYFGLEIVVAIVVVIWAGPKHLSRKHRKQEEQGAAEPGVATPPGVVKPTPA
jgi:membrane protease YdiL (CAAX protease family)